MSAEIATIYFVGTAGCGKSSLTAALAEWMEEQRYNAITLNLDPGVERLPYAPDVDVRDWVRLSDVMHDYGVGPNGAQVLSADLIALKAKELKEELDGYRTDYLLVDTPGQIELFAMRESSHLIVDLLGRGRSLIAFLYDPVLAKRPAGFISLYMLAASVQFRFRIPSAAFLAKVDTLQPAEAEEVVRWSTDFDALHDRLGGSGVFSIELFRALENLGVFGALTPVSAKTREGVDDIYTVVQESFMGGEDTERA